MTEIQLSASRMTAEQRRRQILLAALSTFARRGFHGAGTSEIAAAAGCSEPMLYRHFASKQALFAAALDEGHAIMHERMAAILDGAENPLLEIASSLDQLLEDPLVMNITRLRMIAITLVDDPGIRAALERHMGHVREKISRHATAMQAAGAMRTDVDPDQVAWLWVGAMMGLGFRLAVEGDHVKNPSATLQTLMTSLRPKGAE